MVQVIMKLSPQHRRAISLLAQGMSNKAAAEELGLAPETVSRWKSDFDFKAALNELLQENQRAQQERLRALSSTALTTIETIMTDSTTPAKDRLTAALKVLELTQIAPEKIGSSNADVLAKEDENNKFFESLAL